MAAGPLFNIASNKPPRSPTELGQLIYEEIAKQDFGFSGPKPGRIRALIEEGAQLSLYISAAGETVFDLINGETEVVEKVKHLPQYRGQALVMAAGITPQSTKLVNKLLEDGGIDWTQTDEMGRSAQMLAARLGFSTTAKLIAEQDPLPYRTDNHGWNALMHAAFAGDVGLARFFISKKFPVGQRTPNGYTAIDLALVGGPEQDKKWLSAARADLATLLARSGADVHQKNEKGISPVQFLEMNGLARAREEVLEAAAAWQADIITMASQVHKALPAPEPAQFRKLGRRPV